jgi:3-oxoacyl-[acyl-carrier protein] reductase
MDTEKRLGKKKIVVTGASRGIGLAIADACLREGGDVAATYFSAEGGLPRLKETFGERLSFYKLDVRNPKEAEAVANEAIQRLGGVDALVNNAGISRAAMFIMMTDEQWDEVLQTNLCGARNVTRHILLPMLSQKRGAIVNLSSDHGLMGSAGLAAYCASKAALISLTQTLSKELSGRGIRVNAVAPGYIETDMTDGFTPELKKSLTAQIPMRRFGTAREVSEAVAFLLSDRASYITGQTLIVDGGLM